LEVNGISPVLLPDKSMMDYSIKKIEYQNTEISKTAHIFLEKNEDEIIIDIIQYISSDLLGPGSHEGRVIESKEVFTNGIYILVLDFGSRRSREVNTFSDKKLSKCFSHRLHSVSLSKVGWRFFIRITAERF
jgi:hypothetical protein